GELGCGNTGWETDRGSAPRTGELSRDKPELDDRGTRGRKGARSDDGDGGSTHRRFFWVTRSIRNDRRCAPPTRASGTKRVMPPPTAPRASLRAATLGGSCPPPPAGRSMLPPGGSAGQRRPSAR